VTAAPTRPSPARSASLLDKRLLFVTGKGGVGKSTVAAALGMIAARRGRRTIVAELARRDDVSRALRGERVGATFEEVELTHNLFSISIDPELAMEEYLIDQLPSRTLAERLSASRFFSYLAAATPGLRELLAMGKVWELAQPRRRTPDTQPYDLVVVDAPATGHGVAFLSAPRTFAAAAQVGPIARQARTIHGMLTDSERCGVVAVTAPTQASVAETLELIDALREEIGIELDRVVVNGLNPRHFGAADVHALTTARAELAPGATPGASLERVAIDVALASHARAGREQAQLARLRRHCGHATVALPQLVAPVLGPEQIGKLADALEARL
jgi:anion-transporting  ArsA/GET3 family ATPase